MRAILAGMDTTGLPGADLIEKGIADLADGNETVEALLVRVGGPRLSGLGIDVPADPVTAEYPEHRLYRLLAWEHGDGAHSQYNALIRRLVSFERAADLCAK